MFDFWIFMTPWCLIPNLVCYVAASFLYLAVPLTASKQLTEGKRLSLENMALVLTGFGLLLHLIYLGMERPPSLLAFLSAGILFLFFWLVVRDRWQGIGFFFVPMALILFVISLKQGRTGDLLLADLREHSFFIGAHVVLAVLSFLFFVGALLLGGVAWILERRIREKRLDSFSLNLPPLMPSEKKIHLWLWLGFVCLTLVLMSGVFLLEQASLSRRLGIGHIFLALTAWGLYAWLLRRGRERLLAKNLLLLSAAGFVSLLSLLL